MIDASLMILFQAICINEAPKQIVHMLSGHCNSTLLSLPNKIVQNKFKFWPLVCSEKKKASYSLDLYNR